jgi:hypothetical protein
LLSKTFSKFHLILGQDLINKYFNFAMMKAAIPPSYIELINERRFLTLTLG